ncbi:hypothetical protein [Compostibacter hankyongensis]|uniref:HPF/RaiA family ribosome-associated protein n=1 Tax=Compostibacter hankyongensis TaxID=1007089 RepID=A0ABP8FWI6_9BACT
MQEKIGLYFQLEIEDPRASLSLVKLALDRLSQLKKGDMQVEYFELRLHRIAGRQKDKQAYIKLDGEGHTYIDLDTSSRWDDAFMNAFDRIRDRFRSEETMAAGG